MARFIDKRVINWVEKRLEGMLQLQINREKTNVRTRQGGCLDFLGYTFRYHRDIWGRRSKYLHMEPSDKALVRIREKITKLTTARIKVKLKDVVAKINRLLKGWSWARR